METGIPAKFLSRLVALPTHTKVLLCVATVVFLTELGLRRYARESVFYKKWSGVFLAIGRFWTAILLGLFYFVAVCPMALLMRLFAQDPLDRKLLEEKTSWRSHDPNPLGEVAAARHQF